ncbi:tetratricopeptide repeat protein [Shewanella khirikhana]|uniref:Tetratricopeptide repeat protein n=1 Tax=Shewanella khirikhana TaxID=1965282 RepID=A0ABM7DQG4_9GAMM|nr:tetratricopeptide repeat protein [Shewanella khirikhana]AZQ11929.1 Tetratricopeptide repeat protein [Shewanella khirikhana]
MKIKKILSFLLCVSLATAVLSSWAQAAEAPLERVTVSINPPAVVFSLQSAFATEPRLAPSEQGLAERLKPLLAGARWNDAATLLSGDRAGRSAALLLVEGQVLLAQGRYGDALKVLELALNAQSDMPKAHRSVALAALKAGQADAARKHLVKAISLGAQDAQLFGQLAYLNLSAGAPFGAISGYQQALLLEPDERQWQEGLLHALMSARQNEAALALAEDLLIKRPKDPELWLLRAQLALQTDDEPQALASLEQAIALGEKRADNLMLAARVHLRQGSSERGGELIGRALGAGARFKNASSAIDWLIARGEYRAAELALKKAPANLSGAEQAKLFAARGAIARAKGNDTAARELLEKALKSAPDNGELLLGLAELYAAKGEAARAELYFVRAAALNGVRERALIGHAQLAIAAADWRKAADLLAQALKQNPARRDLVDNLAQLERLMARG